MTYSDVFTLTLKYSHVFRSNVDQNFARFIDTYSRLMFGLINFLFLFSCIPRVELAICTNYKTNEHIWEPLMGYTRISLRSDLLPSPCTRGKLCSTSTTFRYRGLGTRHRVTTTKRVLGTTSAGGLDLRQPPQRLQNSVCRYQFQSL